MDKFLTESSQLIALLQVENEQLRDENRRMHLVVALLRYESQKPKRGRKRKVKQEIDPANKVGRPGLLSPEILAIFPKMIDKIKELHGLKTDVAAIKQMFILSGDSDWRAEQRERAGQLQTLLSKQRSKERKAID